MTDEKPSRPDVEGLRAAAVTDLPSAEAIRKLCDWIERLEISSVAADLRQLREDLEAGLVATIDDLRTQVAHLERRLPEPQLPERWKWDDWHPCRASSTNEITEALNVCWYDKDDGDVTTHGVVPALVVLAVLHRAGLLPGEPELTEDDREAARTWAFSEDAFAEDTVALAEKSFLAGRASERSPDIVNLLRKAFADESGWYHEVRDFLAALGKDEIKDE